MTERTCSVPGCERKHEARGLCRSHYRRWLARGTVEPFPSLTERVWQRVQVGPGCWEWQGRLNEHGYGAMDVEGRERRAHRVVYELTVGPIPDGLVLDHLCSNRPCVNPAHLEPVTQAENLRRSFPGRRMQESALLRTHCKNGHELTSENVYSPPAHPSWRQCRACRNDASRRHREHIRS